jgi:hypothetical protein
MRVLGWGYMLGLILTAFPSMSMALDMSQFVGTVSVEFRSMQAQGILEGCTLVYNVVEQDFAYRQGRLVSVVGNIAYFTNRERNNIALSLKIGTKETFGKASKGEAPHYAYIQTPNATTAKSKFFATDSDTQGAKLFVYDLDKDSMTVLEELISGQPVTVGFNRHAGGMDVLARVDLRVADVTVSPGGKMVRHRTEDALLNFTSCVSDLTEQVGVNVEGR